MVLNRKEIEKLINEKGLIRDYIDLETQLTPGGFDLTVAQIFAFSSPGALDFSNKERKLPVYKELKPKKKNLKDKYGWWHLKKGAYKVRINETFNLPNDLVGLAFPRSSLSKMGAFTHTGAWDAGFRGAVEFILVVENPKGIKLKQNARITQLVFISMDEIDQGYRGIYQHKT